MTAYDILLRKITRCEVVHPHEIYAVCEQNEGEQLEMVIRDLQDRAEASLYTAKMYERAANTISDILSAERYEEEQS